MALVDGAETVGPSRAGPPERPDELTIPTKVKRQAIRVSPAVLAAAGHDGEELLRSAPVLATRCTPLRKDVMWKKTGTSRNLRGRTMQTL